MWVLCQQKLDYFNDTGSYIVRLFTFKVHNSDLFANNIALFVDSKSTLIIFQNIINRLAYVTKTV